MSELIKDENSFTARFEDSDTIIDYCEWCGMDYPRGQWDFYEVKVFGKFYHKIC